MNREDLMRNWENRSRKIFLLVKVKRHSDVPHLCTLTANVFAYVIQITLLLFLPQEVEAGARLTVLPPMVHFLLLSTKAPCYLCKE